MAEHVGLTEKIIGAAIEVHRVLGPGLLESAYQVSMCRELSLRKIPFEQKVPLPVMYKGVALAADFEVDFVVDDAVIVEIKAVLDHHPVFDAQLLSYMKLTKKSVGLLINFHVPVLKDGIRRKSL